MKTVDLAIIGGGMVGLALASSLKDVPIRIAIIECSPPQSAVENITFRVSALNFASQSLLTNLGIWEKLLNLRATSYNRMEVWEKDSFANISFSTNGLGVSQLGYIIENHLIQHVLWEQVKQQKNVEIITALPQKIGITESHAVLTLDNDEILFSKLVAGTDGANSWLRKQVDIPLIFRDYGHNALVCNVETAEPHQNCARQISDHDSILAFLPLHHSHLCSIVWSLPPQRAEILVNCDEKTFNQNLTVAFDNKLGLCQLQSERRTVPLTARYARNFAKDRIALAGDAAHTIHPLAGLGVNLGFQDALLLAKEIRKNVQLNIDIGEYQNLRQYELCRKTEAVKMLVAMQGLKDLFAGSNPLKRLARGIGVNVVNQTGFLKEKLIKQALGF